MCRLHSQTPTVSDDGAETETIQDSEATSGVPCGSREFEVLLEPSKGFRFLELQLPHQAPSALDGPP